MKKKNICDNVYGVYGTEINPKFLGERVVLNGVKGFGFYKKERLYSFIPLDKLQEALNGEYREVTI